MKRMNYLAMVLALALSMPATDMVAQHTGYRGGTTTGNPGGGRVPTAIRKDNQETTVTTVRTTSITTDQATTVMTVQATTVTTVQATTVTTARTAATTDIRGILEIPGITDIRGIQARQTITTDFIQRHRRHVHTGL